MILESIPAIGALTVDQKLKLIGEIWSDVSRTVPVTQEVADLLDERLAEYEANPGTVLTTDQVSANLMQIKEKLSGHSSHA
jgi:putative addiction module component (TIGR02574 family)